MKKKPTTSESVFLLSDIDKTIVRKYYTKGLKWYLINIKQKYIFKAIEHSNIKHPKLLKSRWKYIDLEYIPGKPLDKFFDSNSLVGLISNYMYELRKINCSELVKRVKYRTSSQFLYALVDNTLYNIKKSKMGNKLTQLNLGENVFTPYKNMILDDSRTLSLIHGNLNRENIINNNATFYLIDWEESTYGDIAYELAMHFINENYSKENMGAIIERVCGSNSINQSGLINDISTYITFEYRRRSVKGILKCMNLYKDSKNYNFELENVYAVYSKLPGALSKESIKRVIESRQ